jgi:hypothetical protein
VGSILDMNIEDYLLSTVMEYMLIHGFEVVSVDDNYIM